MREKLSLNLDEMLLEDVKNHLNDYANRCKECESEDYAEINCNVDELAVGIVVLLTDYLRSHNLPSVITKAAEIAGLDRKTVYNYLHS